MKIAPRSHKHPSSGANRPSDVAVTVDINAECYLMAVNPIVGCFIREVVPEYCHGLESSAVYSANPCFVESLPGRSKMSLPHLPLHMHVEEIIPTVSTSNIHIG